jgi:hypothetical protein
VKPLNIGELNLATLARQLLLVGRRALGALQRERSSSS